MNNEFDKRLQDLLRNHTEQPSPDCWDRISSRLDSLQTPNTSNPASSANNVSAFSQFTGSMIGKIAITAAIAASVGTIIYFTVQDNDETLQLAQQELVEINKDAVFMPEDEKKETVNIAFEKTHSANEITQKDFVNTNIDAVMEQEKEELPVVLSPPVVPITVKSVPAVAVKNEPPPQKEVLQNNSQSAKQESVKECVSENELIPEGKEDESKPKIFIPNIITPNRDNNNFFIITNIEQIGENQLDIFTKGGTVVYSKRFYDNSWDGRGLPDGVYYYIFRFTYEGEQFFRKGSVCISRQ